ncbi:hypothetical protein ACQJBY_042872 [Aegilops geniculata]
MLKNYVPPGCPMNLFVKQYHKLQFDREQEEGFQEKRTRLGGVVLKLNIPIGKHASKIYTRTVFEMFGSFLYASGAYMVETLVPKRKYIATHNNAEKQKYRKSVFHIDATEDGKKFTCECGMFEHMGMVCCHILKVMAGLGLKEIPDYHIVKRWTVDATDILPEHLKHYQKDQGRIETPTFRHTSLYNAALELVMLGDTNVEAYDIVMQAITDTKHKVQPLCENKDGMSVVEKTATLSKNNAGSIARGSCSRKQPAEAFESSVNCRKDKARLTTSECSTVNGVDNGIEDSAESLNDVFSPDRSHYELEAPPPKRSKGSPCTSREKTPYENKDKRSRFCAICRGKGHKCTTCPMRGDTPMKPRKEARCSNYGLTGHRKNSCSKPAYLNG